MKWQHFLTKQWKKLKVQLEPLLIMQVGCSEQPIAAPVQGTGTSNRTALLCKQPPCRKIMLYDFKMIVSPQPPSSLQQLFLNMDLGGGGAVLHEWKQHGCSLICWSISVLGKKAHKYWAGRICMCHPRAQFSRWKMRTEPWQFLPVSLLDRKIENDRESYLSKDTVSGQKPG